MIEDTEITLVEMTNEQLFSVSGGATFGTKNVPHCPYCGSPSIDLIGAHVRYEGMTFQLYQCAKCFKKTVKQQIDGAIPMTVDFTTMQAVEESMG